MDDRALRERIAEELKRDAHEAFDPPHTTLNVGRISGGTAKNVIAGECRFTLEWRPVPGQSAERVLDYLREAVEDEKRLDESFACEIRVLRLDEGADAIEPRVGLEEGLRLTIDWWKQSRFARS